MVQSMMFACSPLWFQFALNFSQTCNTANLVTNPGLLDQECTESRWNRTITDLSPVTVTNVFIEELYDDDLSLDLQAYQFFPGNFSDGDTFNYTSALTTNRTVFPFGIQININGLNNASEEINQNFYVIYSNENYEPVLKPGDSIGWVRIVSVAPV